MIQTVQKEKQAPTTWIPLLGNWEIKGNVLEYSPQYDPDDPKSQAVGVAICDMTLEDGTVEVTVQLANIDGNARIIFRSRETNTYYSAGVGGYGVAFVIDRFDASRGWRAIATAGTNRNLDPQRAYKVRVTVEGPTIALFVDGIPVLRHVDPNPLKGDGLGLFAWKTSGVTFSDFTAARKTPEAFVLMEFSPEFDPIYEDVIRPTADKVGYNCRRADDVKRPGIILNDIYDDIARATVVVAEITTANPNVYYEVGVAHALGIKTILLAQEGTKPPFDIGPHRIIFYSDRIRGSRQLQAELAQHLESVMSPGNGAATA